MRRMRKAVRMTASCSLLALGLWIGYRGVERFQSNAPASSRNARHGAESTDGDETANPLRTKRGNREASGPRATHSPQRLKEFMLPEVAIDGLTLDEALRKLMEVYNETCAGTGETGLRLTFDVPPGATKKLHLRLRGGNFASSVRILAAMSGMTVSRRGPVYQFKPVSDARQPVSRTFRVSPDFTSRLDELAGHSGPDSKTPVDELLRTLDGSLDPSTRVALGASGVLTLDTNSAADAAMVAALIETIKDQKRLQQKFTTTVIELAANSDWTPPDTSRLNDSEFQSLIRGIAANKAATMTTLPSVTALPGQDVTVEMTRDFFVPVDESEEMIETHAVGKVMHIKGSPLGFGHDLAFNFSATSIKVNPETGKPLLNRDIDLEDAGFSSDNGGRLVMQARPDGSKAILVVTPSLIDATGAPVNGSN